MINFKEFLINEEKGYLGHKISDILTSTQELHDDIENIGSRHLARLAEEIVNQIRKIIHGDWSSKSGKSLKELQKIGVAIQKTIDDKGDLKQIIPSAIEALQSISGDMGRKVNNLNAPSEDVSMKDFQQTTEMPVDNSQLPTDNSQPSPNSQQQPQSQ